MFVFGMILGLPGTVLGLPETVQQFGLTLADRGLLISTLFHRAVVWQPAVRSFRRCTGTACLADRVVGARGAVSADVRDGVERGARGVRAVRVGSGVCEHQHRVERAVVRALSRGTRPTHERHCDHGGPRRNGDADGDRAGIASRVLASGRRGWRCALGGRRAVRPHDRLRSRSAAVSKGTDPITALRQFAKQPAFALFLLLIMLGGGNEASMAGWTSSFVSASGLEFIGGDVGVVVALAGADSVARVVLGSSRSRESDRGRTECGAERTRAPRSRGLSVARCRHVRSVCRRYVHRAGDADVPGTRGRAHPGEPRCACLEVCSRSRRSVGMVLPAAIGLVAEHTSVRLGLALLIGSYGVDCIDSCGVSRRMASGSRRKPGRIRDHD